MATVYDPAGRKIAYGTTSIASNLISAANRVCVLSDSTWNRVVESTFRPFFRSSRIRTAMQFQPVAYASGSYKIPAAASMLGGTQNYSPFFGAYEVAIPGTFGAETTWWTSNMLAAYAWEGPTVPGLVPGVDDNSTIYGGNLVVLSKTAGLRATVFVYAGPHGDPLSQLKAQVYKSDGTLLVESAAFNGYNATPIVRTVTMDVASWSGVNQLTVFVRGVPSVTNTASKHLVLLGCSFSLLTAASTSQRWDVLSYGGELVTNYTNTANISSGAWSLMNANNYDAFVLALGINGYGLPDLATWKTGYQNLINLIRGTNSTLPIVMTTQLPLAANYSDFMDSLEELVDANANTLAIDTRGQLPAYSVCSQGWVADWQTGSRYNVGDSVYRPWDGGVFVCKNLHNAVLEPEDDATNWILASASFDNTVTLKKLFANYVIEDGVHPHKAGQRLYASAIWSALETTATYDLGSSGLADLMADTYAQAKIAAANTQS